MKIVVSRDYYNSKSSIYANILVTIGSIIKPLVQNSIKKKTTIKCHNLESGGGAFTTLIQFSLLFDHQTPSMASN